MFPRSLALGTEMAVHVLAGYWDLDLETGELLLCPRSRRMFGLADSSRKKLTSFDWQPRIHPDDMAAIEGELEIAGRHNDVYSARFRTVRPDGSICEVLGVGRATANNPNRFVGLNFDLNDTAARAVRESRGVGSMIALSSSRLSRGGPANENDARPWHAWSPVRPAASRNHRSKIDRERQGLALSAQATLEARQLRKKFLSSAMFGEPAFDLLLALYVPASSGMMTARVLSALIDASLSATIRWLRFLVKEGLALTMEATETDDPGAMTATLTDKGRLALDAYFRAAGDTK